MSDTRSSPRIRLPLLPQAASEAPLAAGELAAASASLARRILVVDDNRDAAISLAMLLNMVGHSTHVAHDGQAAIERRRRRIAHPRAAGRFAIALGSRTT